MPRVLVTLAVLASCAPSDDTGGDPTQGVPTDGGLYLVTATADPDPPMSGDAALALHIALPEGDPVLGAEVTVTPWMTSMDHGVTGDVAIEELGAGDYRASWSYPMPGWWDITVTIDGEAGADALEFGHDVQ